MKKRNLLLLVAMITAMVIGSVGVYADTLTDAVEMDKVLMTIEGLELPAGAIDQESVIEALEAEGIAASSDPFAYISSFADLEAALADGTKTIFILMGDIGMEYPLTIDRTISMAGISGSTTITSGQRTSTSSESGDFHFIISGNAPITFTCSNIVLDGGDVSGGVLIESAANIKNLVVQNCNNLYGAITTERAMMQSDPVVNSVSESLSTNFDITLEGCTIKNNNAARRGGGVNAWKVSALTIKSCNISHNLTGTSGGGIYASANSLFVTGSEITNNIAEVSGGGIYSSGVVLVEDSTVTQNEAGSSGGGICMNDGYAADAELIVQSSEITHNQTSNHGGGIYVNSSQAVSITDCLIANNTAADDGGGIFYYKSYGQINANLTIENSIITQNEGRFGGGIHAYHGLTIQNSEVTYNQADAGGGIFTREVFEDIDLTGTAIAHNTAMIGGGMGYNNGGGDLNIIGGIFEKNEASMEGGAIYMAFPVPAYVTLFDMELRDNYAASGGGAIYLPIYALSRLTVNEDVIFSGNTADAGYYITNSSEIEAHNARVHTTHFSAPFEYAYNNFDIYYPHGTLLEAETVSFYLRYSDTEPYLEIAIYAGQALGTQLPPVPELAGFRPLGWIDGQNNFYDEETAITESVSLYPVYIPN